MTREEANSLIKVAMQFVGRRNVLSYRHPQVAEDIVESNNLLVRIDENNVDDNYNPLAVYQEEGDPDGEWSEDLQKTLTSLLAIQQRKGHSGNI